MRDLLFAVLVLSCASANAQVYKCPDFYPIKDAPLAGTSRVPQGGGITLDLPVTNAVMYRGDKHGNGALHGDDEPVKGGTDAHYGFPDNEPRWLVCQYGGRKRISGSVIAGHEWGAQVVGHVSEWWVPLDQKVDACDLKIREVKSGDRGNSTWAATAVCKNVP
jgi:hypothetical protein